MTRLIRVQEFDDLFFGRLGGPRAMIFVRSAFDASMEHPEGITVVAGYLGHPDDWRAVEEIWPNLLSLHGLPKFHLTEIFNRYTNRGAALDCVERFADAISRSKLRTVYAQLHDVDWEKLHKDSLYRKTYPRREHACLDLLFGALAEEADLEFKNQPIAVVLDSDYGKIAKPAAVYDAWQSRTGHPGFRTIAFNKEDVDWSAIPIQCADLLAGMLRHSPFQAELLKPSKDRNIEATARTREYRICSKASRRGRGTLWSIAIAKEVEEILRKHRASSAERAS